MNREMESPNREDVSTGDSWLGAAFLLGRSSHDPQQADIFGRNCPRSRSCGRSWVTDFVIQP
jgi:hypothetical protein